MKAAALAAAFSFLSTTCITRTGPVAHTLRDIIYRTFLANRAGPGLYRPYLYVLQMTLPLFPSAPAFGREGLAQKLRALAAEKVFIGTSSWKYEGWCGMLYDAAQLSIGTRPVINGTAWLTTDDFTGSSRCVPMGCSRQIQIAAAVFTKLDVIVMQ